MSAIILESSLVHYEALGRGKPLLFLHDWLGSWRYWVPTMVDMSSSYRAYALDFWGFGDSDKVATRYSIPGYVSQVELFMDQMGINCVPIVGHGLGGIVGANFALAHPERVEQLMTVCTPLSGSDIARSLSGFSGGDNPAKVILGRRLKSYEEVDIEAAKTDANAVVQSVRNALSHNLLDDLEDLDMPVLLACGREDPIIQAPEDAALGRLNYNVYPFIFETAQHYPMLEETSKFDRLLRDFLMYKDNWDEIEVKDEWKRRMR
ncbi:MAG TPA: alpha/beta hydrolase [Anaerolineae bacterium]|nr:alpha/beta hydrolase [Anaerolineae bacterium]HQH38965.1 alpha/beta hydrolase [Anaerolineae bacterium]